MTIGFSLGRSTCLSDSTIADNDTLDCLHLVLNSIVTASATWDGRQAEWRAEACSDGGQGWSKRSAPAKERVEWPVFIVNVSGVLVVASRSPKGPQLGLLHAQQPAASRGGTTSAHYSLLTPSSLQYSRLIHILLHSIPVARACSVLLLAN